MDQALMPTVSYATYQRRKLLQSALVSMRLRLTVDGWRPSSVAKCLSHYISDKQEVYLKWLAVYL